jgi:DNA repair protein RadC
MRIKVLDHIIIGDNKYYSFSGEALIEKYETDFVNLMLRDTT